MLDNPDTKELKYLTYNLHWQELGWDFEDIMQVRSQLKGWDPFLDVGIREINSEIGGLAVKKYTSTLGFNTLKYVYLDESDFDGDLTFLKYCPNLEHLFILGISVKSKISDLSPIAHLLQLQYLYLEYHNISDITPLTNLINLRYLYIQENPINSIEPICKLTHLREANFEGVTFSNVFELLKNSREAKVRFYYEELELSLTAYWIEDGAYGTFYFKDYDILTIEIFALMNYMISLNENTKGLMQQKITIIANQLLRADEEISNISFSTNKGSCVIKGLFSYSRKGD